MASQQHWHWRGVSTAYYVDFPSDPEMGRTLPVHYPLAYQRLAAYDFDPNAEFLYALELLPQLREWDKNSHPPPGSKQHPFTTLRAGPGLLQLLLGAVLSHLLMPRFDKE